MSLCRKVGVSAGLVGGLVALACWISPESAGAVSSTTRLTVEYRNHALTVDAQGVPLAEVLSRIGSSVGFTVVDTGGSPTPVSVSIQSSSIEDALRQLLRGENHTMIYRSGEGGTAGIETIVLLGAPGQTKHPEEGLNGRQADYRPQSPSGAVPNPAAPVTGPAPPMMETVPFVPGERFSVADAPTDPGSGPMTVQDMLKAHAMAGLPAAQDAADRAPASRAPSASAPPVSPEASLAETTRRAQESLSTLMNQLAAATRSLQAANGAGGK